MLSNYAFTFKLLISLSPLPLHSYELIAFLFLLFCFVFINLFNYTSHDLQCSPTVFAPYNSLFLHLHATSHTLLWTLSFSLSLLSFFILIHLLNYTSYALQLCLNLITYYFFISTSNSLLGTFKFNYFIIIPPCLYSST